MINGQKFIIDLRDQLKETKGQMFTIENSINMNDTGSQKIMEKSFQDKTSFLVSKVEFKVSKSGDNDMIESENHLKPVKSHSSLKHSH